MQAQSIAAQAAPAGKPVSGDVQTLLQQLQAQYADCITGTLELPASDGHYCPLPAALDPAIVTALASRGITQLYSHQAEAWQAITAGQHTVIVTPTASGKSLCYNLPVMQAIRRGDSKAMYLFPTKALAQDQVSEINAMNQAGALGIKAFTFDGDTPGDARRAVRTRGDIVVTNPDMLHQGILPHHTKWAQFFENLDYVVIDEMHTYRGVFGSHVANLLRRLRRICRFYRRQPRFIFCTATIANATALARQLVEDEVHGIEKNGAPRGRKTVLLWNPPVVNADLGIRASARSQTSRVARAAMDAGLQSIVFAQSRLMVEVLTKYLKDAYDSDPRKPLRVKAYRGGYLPNERRDTERRLRDGELDCVVSTSALELGVDIGALDVCILNGYPGTIASTWQRLGRAGRRNRDALGILIGSSRALDQYMVRNPEYFLGASPEHARIDPEQMLIKLDHVRCAAFELPFHDDERFGADNLPDFLHYLANENVLHHDDDSWHWMTDDYPANSVSLRSVADGNFLVIDTSDGKQDIIAEVDYSAAAMTLYEGAIYMVQAQPWQVETLDWVGRKAFVTRTQADYYTDAIDYTRLKMLENFAVQGQAASTCTHGEVHVVRRVSGYKKIRYYSHENIGYGPINLPDQEMHTTALWWQIRHSELNKRFASRQQALDGFLGAAHALHFVAALVCMSEASDLGRAVGNADSKWFAHVGSQGRGRAGLLDGNAADIEHGLFQPTLFLYDNYPGGVGLSEPLYAQRDDIIGKALTLVRDCPCEHGCPACVGPVNSYRGTHQATPKENALTLLEIFHEH